MMVLMLLVLAVVIVAPMETCYTCDTLRYGTKGNIIHERKSGVYTIRLPSGKYQAYCEMGINGGGYTFLSNMDIQKLTNLDMSILFRKKTDVLLRISKTDGTQPYTVIKSIHNNKNLSLQLNSYNGYFKPVNSLLGPYLFLGVIPKLLVRNTESQGFVSNNKKIRFRSCGRGLANGYFAFFTNPMEKAVHTYHSNNLVYERQGVAVDWRRSAKRMPSSRRMPLAFFLLTELHFGGCGTYTSSDRWLKSGAIATAIGFR